MQHARDIWQHIPGFLKAPELERDDPAFVVVADRPVFLPTTGGDLGGAGRPRVADADVVCVAIKGEPTYYTSVDLRVVRP